MPRLSVVVPVYNVEKYLNQCIDSILGQSFSDFELIIVNDGSTDDSGSICDQYAMADPRVRVIHTENRGVVTARRTGVNMARGEYTVFVDSDDWLDLDFYRCLIEGGEGMNADILISGNLKRAAGCVKTTVFPSGYYDKKTLENTIYFCRIFSTNHNVTFSIILISIFKNMIHYTILFCFLTKLF